MFGDIGEEVRKETVESMDDGRRNTGKNRSDELQSGELNSKRNYELVNWPSYVNIRYLNCKIGQLPKGIPDVKRAKCLDTSAKRFARRR
jgi:hypothetical protein